ncbi:MAG TPA: hypothetical protein VMH35_03700 [Streptosporangiaceae bacterium]|nr:hypothetical protein [Streptosporangiaceae bacterium]
MSDHGLVAAEVSRLRRGGHEFLRRHAARAWEHQHDGVRWDITLPPDVAALPEHQRFRAHARQEARRLAVAQLYDLDAGITARAADHGAAIRQGRHAEAVALAGHPRVAATMGIDPPAASGFLRWRDPGGIGYNPLGAPVLACHWGPAPGGTWLAWWADGQAMAAGYAAQAQAAGLSLSADSVTRIFGPLWYDHQELLRPGAASTRPGSSIPQPGPAVADAGPSSAEAGTPGLVLLYTTLATWQLLACPAAVSLSPQPVPAAELAADRAAGLRTGPVTIAMAARIP